MRAAFRSNHQKLQSGCAAVGNEFHSSALSPYNSHGWTSWPTAIREAVTTVCSTGSSARYAIPGLDGSGIYIFKAQDKPVEPAVQAAKPAPPPLPPPPAATPRPSPPPAPAPPAGPSAAQIGQARNLIADARRSASLGDFSGAETALQNADKAAPGFAEVTQARRDIAELRTAVASSGR